MVIKPKRADEVLSCFMVGHETKNEMMVPMNAKEVAISRDGIE